MAGWTEAGLVGSSGARSCCLVAYDVVPQGFPFDLPGADGRQVQHRFACRRGEAGGHSDQVAAQRGTAGGGAQEVVRDHRAGQPGAVGGDSRTGKRDEFDRTYGVGRAGCYSPAAVLEGTTSKLPIICTDWRHRDARREAVLVYRKSRNHVLHHVLSVFLCRFWVLVWLFVTAIGGQRRTPVWLAHTAMSATKAIGPSKVILWIISALWLVLMLVFSGLH
jgi:hypothetical protein